MALQPGGRRRSLIGQQWTTALHHNLSPSNYYAALVNNGQVEILMEILTLL
jgi:hypothetical protein